jgi:hypothetical protein
MPSTFVCDRYQYPIEQLQKETLNSPLRVVIRGYAEIRRGKITYFDRSDAHAHRGHDQRSKRNI